MQETLEMAVEKEPFLVPAPPPPLKPPPRGGAGGAVPAQGPPPEGAASEGGGDAPPRQPPRGAPHPPKATLGGGGQRRAAPPPKADPAPQEDSVLELQRPRNGLQPPQKPPGGGGKRRNSCHVGGGGGGGGGGFKNPAFKRRRRVNSECDPVLPSEFLLGGNIFDPLNLNSLLDEEVNQALNAETPKSSPLPAKGRDPVEILIPKDITDPLSLNNAQEDPPVLASPIKSGRKRHRHRGAQRGAASVDSNSKPIPSCKSCQKTCNGATPQPYELNTAINCRDEVISPLLSSGGEQQQSQQILGCVTPSCTSVASSTGGGSRHHHRKRRRTCSRSEGAGARYQGGTALGEQLCRSSPERGRSTPKSRHPQATSSQQPRRQARHKFQYGNYCKYYGYRNPNCEDLRLRVMKPEWFQGKEVLDVGCNVGHLTLSVAKKWGPTRMVGVDIDGALIHSARQNIRHYLSEEIQQQQCDRSEDKGTTLAKKTFPASLAASRGPIAAPRVPQEGVDAAVFPNNVIFVKMGRYAFCDSWALEELEYLKLKSLLAHLICPDQNALPLLEFQGNYVLERDELLDAQKPEYDVILCLSLTKWVHLNWGDEGLRRLFKRFYRHLRPGGILVLEPQAWSSYGKRKNLTETICRNYHRIKLKPDQFPLYLTSPEVGFSSYELVATPRNTSKGFQRPIYLFHKASPGTH